MRPSHIESWALEIVDLVRSGTPVEDSRVELKATWIDPGRAARRVAGHANAARGAPILWLIGVDEKYGVVGVDSGQFLRWHRQMCACFDGLAPPVTDLIIPVNNSSLVALLFETERAPFVVQNPVFGNQGGGPVQWEVPWREGTAIRSAGRRELLRVLTPMQPRPDFEVLSGMLQASLTGAEEGALFWQLSLSLYNVTLSEDRIVIPFHKCRGSFTIGEHQSWTSFDSLLLRPPYRVGGFSSSLQAMLSLTIQGTPEEVFLTGPGKLLLEAEARRPMLEDVGDAPVRVSISLLPIDADYPLKLDLTLQPALPENGAVYRWDWTPS